MIEIFIPVLIICFSDVCENFQSIKTFKTEQECKQALVVQKRELVDYAKKRNWTIISSGSTCVGPQTDNTELCGIKAQHICRK